MRLTGETAVAVLYADPKGVYQGINGVGLWDITKDARKYEGIGPVIAHPPCQLWTRFAHVNYKRWGGEHNKPGNDGGCFASALAAVKRCGGVLEHPAYSDAWKHFGLPRPNKTGWMEKDGAYVCEVWQSAYGHKANKKTWLLYCGVNPPHELNWSRPKGTHQIGFHDQRGKARNKPTISGKAASATPILFRDELIKLARNCGGNTRKGEKGGVNG